MPSGAKRRRNAQKKKNKKAAKATSIISNGNDEVKVVESDGAENSSSPASQDLQTQCNPFTKDENKEPSLSTESNGDGEIENGDANECVKGGVNHGGLSKCTNGSLSSDDNDGSQVVEVEARNADKEASKIANYPVSFAKDASIVKDADSHVSQVVEIESNVVAQDKLIHEPERLPVQKSVGSTVAELKSKNYDEKVHPSETLSASKADSPPISYTYSVEEGSIKQLPESNILIINRDCRAESSDIQQCPEKEPLLLPAPGQANKTSWIGCCGLLELFTGSSR